ncbi:MAG TPA: hypothetical protein VFS33_04625 [Gemmatimonadales bacterium]|nr:hypothetical protein [Gemmatimonadales bacterium]
MPILVLGAALVGGFIAARPMLEQRLAAWRKEHPVVDFAIAAMPMAGGALKTVTELAASDSGRGAAGSKRLEGVNDKRALPADIPVWPKAEEELFNIGPDHATVFQRVRGPTAPIVSYYKQRMRAAGWSASAEQNTHEATVLAWTKGARRCKVDIVQRDGGVAEVWIRSRRVGSGQ